MATADRMDDIQSSVPTAPSAQTETSTDSATAAFGMILKGETENEK